MNMRVASLFSGIGGIDLGFKQAGFKIVWANEIDKFACQTYIHNFGKNSIVQEDIKKINAKDIPDFEVLVAGFPCQPFSIAGRQKGFKDKRGNLFFEIIKVVDEKRPKIICLENVANLVEHDDGKTFLVIYNSLVQFGYTIYYKILSAYEYGNVPQRRKRIFIVAVKDGEYEVQYNHPEPVELTKTLEDIIFRNEQKNEIYYYAEDSDMFKYLNGIVTDKNSIYKIVDSGVRKCKSPLCPTLLANMGTFPDRVPIVKDDFGIRKLTLRECLDIQGFPKEYYFPKTIPVEEAYKQIGNSVCVPVVKRIAEQIKITLEKM